MILSFGLVSDSAWSKTVSHGSAADTHTPGKAQHMQGDSLKLLSPFPTQEGFFCEPTLEKNIDGDPSHWRLKADCYVENRQMDGGGDQSDPYKKPKHQLCQFVWDSKTQKASVLARKTVPEKRNEMLPLSADAESFVSYRMLQSTHEVPGLVSEKDLVRDMQVWTGLKCGQAEQGKDFQISYVDSNPAEPLKSGWQCEFRRSHAHGRETARAYLCSDPEGKKSCQYMTDRYRNQYKFFRSMGRVENSFFEASEPAPAAEVKYDRSYSLMKVSDEDFYKDAYKWLNKNCGT